MEQRNKEDNERYWNGYGSLEEELLEDTEPELIDISLSGSCSSNRSSARAVPQSISPSGSDSSVNTCISPPPMKLRPRSKLSLSLHDISEFPEHGVDSSIPKSQSMTALPSARQPRETGLPRSMSMQGRISGSRKYDHVQSKVKEYIRNIKAETARNRKLRASREAASKVFVPPKRTEVDELRQKLSDSELYISVLRNNYQELFMKHAAAQRTIDEMRNNKPVSRDTGVQTVAMAPLSPLPKSYTSTLKLKLSPDNSLVFLGKETLTNESAAEKQQVDVDASCSYLQDDVISKVKHWQDSLSSSPNTSLEQAVEAKPADSSYADLVPNVTEVPPLKLGSLLDSNSSTLSCSMQTHASSSSYGDLESVIAALQNLYDPPDSASTSYRSIRRPEMQQAINSLSDLKGREVCKGHIKLSSEDKRTLLKCLEDLNVFAERVKSRSEAMRSILSERLRSTK